MFSIVFIRDYLEPLDEEDLSWSITRTADIELSVAQGAEGWPGWVRWFVGLDSEEETLDWIATEVALLADEGKLTEEGTEVASEIVALAEGKESELSEEEWRQKYKEGLYSWERIAAREQFAARCPGMVA